MIGERIRTRDQRFDGGVVSKHREDDTARMRDVACALRAMRTLGDERISLRRSAIVNRQMESGGDQVSRHRQSHRTEPDESNFLCHAFRLALGSTGAMKLFRNLTRIKKE